MAITIPVRLKLETTSEAIDLRRKLPPDTPVTTQILAKVLEAITIRPDDRTEPKDGE